MAREKPLIDLEKLLALSAAHIYWLDRDNVYQGCNEKQAKSSGLSSRFDIVGKKNRDLPWNKNTPEIATLLDNVNLEVMSTGVPRVVEEPGILLDGTEAAFLSNKIPLRANDGKVIGLLGISVDITNQKLQEARLKAEKKEAAFILDYILAHMPIHIYWKDKDGVYLGSNDKQAKSLGLNYGYELVGKTDFDLTWKKGNAAIFRINDLEVMSSGNMKIVEESAIFDGKEAIVLSQKVPLRNSCGEITGVLGISIDITDHKKTEELQLKLQKIKLQEQENFRTLAEQVAHDIRSPLASLSMIVASCKNLPEGERIALKDVATSITDIANNLLSKYKKYNDEIDAEKTPPENILVALALTEVLSEKKYQYKNFPVKFNYHLAPNNHLASIKVDPSNFNRMISNLINNAVEAFDGKKGEVSLKLNLVGENVEIIVQDNGKGMPRKIIDKIMDHIVVTSGKKDGSGIGFAQVQSTLHANKGKMSIESKIGEGTKIILTFPRVESPNWIAAEIILPQNATVIVLDDDPSIHSAWKMRFKLFKNEIKLHHFKSGEDTIKFINKLNAKEKDQIFLLSDFELINQELNGLQIIEKLKMQDHAVLVTSHYHNQKVRDLAAKAGVKILPKQLASDIPIEIAKKEKNKKAIDHFKKVDLVIIDDMQMFADSLACFFQNKSMVVDTYYNPKRFLENLSQYTKDTKICLDNDFQSKLTGIELAQQLNKAGFTKLYMLTGMNFAKNEVPSYLTLIIKGNMDDLNKLL